MSKSADAFRTISEVADWLDTPAHVLRFWESKFTQVKPVKRAGGRRYYRPADMLLLGGIKRLLHEDGMTIKGVQKLLREKGVGHVAGLAPPLDGESEVEEATAITPPKEAEVVTFPVAARPAPVAQPDEASTEATEAEPDAPAAEAAPVETPVAEETTAEETVVDETVADETAADETAAEASIDATSPEEPTAGSQPPAGEPVEASALQEPAPEDPAAPDTASEEVTAATGATVDEGEDDTPALPFGDPVEALSPAAPDPAFTPEPPASEAGDQSGDEIAPAAFAEEDEIEAAPFIEAIYEDPAHSGEIEEAPFIEAEPEEDEAQAPTDIFAHRAPPAPRPSLFAMTQEPVTPTPGPRAASVTTPPDPADSELVAAPGLLSRISERRTGFSAQDLAHIRPLAARLAQFAESPTQ